MVCDNVACDKVVCVKEGVWQRWRVARMCVKHGVWQSWVVTKMCVKDGVTMMCFKDVVWQRCVRVWRRCVWKMVRGQDGVWQSCVWKMVCDKVVCDKVVCDTRPEPAKRQRCHDCYAKRRSMLPSATPATQNSHSVTGVTGDQGAPDPAQSLGATPAPSATPATQNAGQVPT